MRRRRFSTIFAAPGTVQGIYYVISGTWPLIAYRSFEAITGRKREPWLVKMVGLVTVVVGSVLVTDPVGRTPQARRLGVGSALAYAAVEVWYAGVRRRISPVYLLDALVELGLAAAWALNDLRARATAGRAGVLVENEAGRVPGVTIPLRRRAAGSPH